MSGNWTHHEDNEKLATADLLQAAIDEVHNAIGRQNGKKQPAFRMSVPPQRDDTDILILDALHRALEVSKPE